MNRFQKLSRWLVLVVTAVIIILLAFIFRPKSAVYKLNSMESLKLINDPSLRVSEQDMSGKQLIDVRTPEIYAQGHPENAVNIPVRKLLDKESLALFDKLLHNGKEAVLFGTDELQVTAPLFLLQQMGYQNIKIWAGGYAVLNGFKNTEVSASEVPLITSSLLEVSKKNPSTENAPSAKKTKVIPVRRKASSGGGC
jgi:rhodanese-related sulfurtransferase